MLLRAGRADERRGRPFVRAFQGFRLDEWGMEEYRQEAAVYKGKAVTTILLVEDEESVRSLVTMVLRESGYDVIATANARDATEIADAELSGIELLISDISLPDTSGRELARQLAVRNPSLRVLLMSGLPEYLRTAADNGTSVKYLDKPFFPTELLESVHEALCANDDDFALHGWMTPSARHPVPAPLARQPLRARRTRTARTRRLG